VGERLIRDAGYTVGALTHRTVGRLAEQLGFAIIHVDDLPHSTRTVTDLENGRIYLPQASIPGGHGLRSLALQAIAHRVLGHERPASYADFLRQRIEINYFASACLIPRTAAVDFLTKAKAAKDLAVEDFRDAFGVTHEAAAHRLTNLATAHLGIPMHFLRVGDDGAIYRGYENDGVPLPEDPTGAIEGQSLCRRWMARSVFGSVDRTTENYQYTDTPAGTFWCSSQTGSQASGQFSITVGVPYVHAKWFRGRETTVRQRSTCPDVACCRLPGEEQSERWQGKSWPSAALHAQVLAPLPAGSFPGVDDAEVYAFLSRHAPRTG
jgi:predicted transcriptional regulator